MGIAYLPCGPSHRRDRLAREKALAYYQQAQQLQEKLLAKSPDDRERLNALGDTYNALGVVLKKGQRLDEALEALGKAREIRQKLVDAVFRKTRSTGEHLPTA